MDYSLQSCRLGQLSLVKGHQLRGTKIPSGWEIKAAKAARSSGFGVSRLEQHTGRVHSLTTRATNVRGMGKHLEWPSSFTEQMSPVAPRRAAGDTYVGLDMLEKAVG